MQIRRLYKHRRVIQDIDIIWPDFIEVGPRELRVGNRFTRSFMAVSYPRQVYPGWFDSLLRFPYPLTIAFYQGPLPPQIVLRSMKRHLLWSRGLDNAGKTQGHLSDPSRETAIEDAERIRQKLAQGDARILETSLFMTLWAATQEELNEATAMLQNLCESMLITIRPLHFQHLQGFKWTWPLGEHPSLVREMESDTWATFFPLVSEEIVHEQGILWGTNPQNHSLILVNRFLMPAPHSITIAWSGAGKSYAAKLEVLRARYQELPVYIIDPEGEYTIFRDVGADVWSIGQAQENHFPFDPFTMSRETHDFEHDSDFLIRFLSRLLPHLENRLKMILPPVLWSHWKSSSSPKWSVTPLTVDISELLEGIVSRDKELAEQLDMAMTRWRTLVGTKARDSINPHFQVFDLSHLTTSMKNAAYLAISEWLTRQTFSGSRRLIIFDEAWHLLTDQESAKYLESLFRRARKWGTALSLITQDMNDFVRSQTAEVCLRNAPIVLLLKQHPESLQQLAASLRLHEGEVNRIAQAGMGEGVLMVGEDHVPIRIMGAPFETRILHSSYRN
ncbi:hypothetical protein SAMN00768000_2303 [Sulfobacillus thermosulfidooxidans DSM 9293]|uniref:TraG P-loop domain-containing protein n=1 Tax=Sulfobacillus thermosulfidooxidans (strain DSM 9293 / VKM B-1269 / AT-1) TaxID=929705 RepID=A0A1W1WH16_SULTA|nr:hypothetical protein SAMN00768000_2303 [Sulfobacillus thermosulfidooxidans DSM 9293]